MWVHAQKLQKKNVGLKMQGRFLRSTFIGETGVPAKFYKGEMVVVDV